MLVIYHFLLFFIADSNSSFFSPACPPLWCLMPSFLILNSSTSELYLCVTGFDFHPSPYTNSSRASFPFLSSSCHFTTRSHWQEGVNISYKCSEEEKIEWILRCLLASCLWHHYSSGMAMFHACDPPAGTNSSATPQQHTQKTTCLTANCLRGALQSLAIYVSGSDTVSLFNCLFSYQACK